MTLQPYDQSLNKYSLEYSFEELEWATNNFDPRGCLGSGAFGAVYRGTCHDGAEVAVKTFDEVEGSGFEEEVRVLSKFRSPNLVCLMGFGRSGSQRFLVYELLEGGDVYHRLLRSKELIESFPWKLRVSVALDAARGLSRMHHATPKAFHRDIKSPNIMLDRKGTAKMADFGLACLSHTRTHKVELASGTVGYACPHYVTSGVVTEGSEAYSFGIVLLELLTAMPPAVAKPTPEGAQEYDFLLSHISAEASSVMPLLDKEAAWPPQVAYEFAELALRCTQYNQEQRPNFAEIVNVLRPLQDAPEIPPAQTGTAFALPHRRVHEIIAEFPVGKTVIENRAPADGGAPGAVLGACRPSGDWHSLQRAANPAPAMVAAPQDQAPVPVQSLLWSLVCEIAEGAGLNPRLVLPHYGDKAPTCLTVGRALQEDLFTSALRNEENLMMVSREHFKIWAEPEPLANAEAVETGTLPYAFFLENLALNWTSVNGQLLMGAGACARLHNGDLVALGQSHATAAGGVRYAPFIQFRFDLTGSALRALGHGSPEDAAMGPGIAQVAREMDEEPDPEEGSCSQSSHLATALCGFDVAPFFLLEIGWQRPEGGPTAGASPHRSWPTVAEGGGHPPLRAPGSRPRPRTFLLGEAPHQGGLLCFLPRARGPGGW